MDFRRDCHIDLPLPLAQLCRRAFSTSDGRVRHDKASYLVEALIKWAVAPLVAGYLDQIKSGEPRVASLDRLPLPLAFRSPGLWASIARELSRHFSQRSDASNIP